MKFKINHKVVSIVVAATVVVTSFGSMQAGTMAAAEDTQLPVAEQAAASVVFRYDQSAGQAIANQKDQERAAAQAAAQAAAEAAAQQAAAQAAAESAKAAKDTKTTQRSTKPTARSYSQAGTIGQTVVNVARSCIGIPYGASYNGTTMDCSGLTSYAYKQVGISLPHSSSGQAQWCSSRGYEISRSALQPGDLVFWQYPWGSGYMGIGHVGIYSGNGKVIDASPNGVVERSLYDQGSIVFCGRPY